MKVLNVATIGMAMVCTIACGTETPEEVAENEDNLLELFFDAIPNNTPIWNRAGSSASYSTEGFVNLDNEFHTPQGTNGRHCATCHASDSGWSISPVQVGFLFAITGGTHPLFAPRDANNPNADFSTVGARRQAYSRLIERGLFRRSVSPPTGDYEVIAATDPHGYGATTRLVTFRRPLSTANLPLSTALMWDDRNTVAGDGNPPRLGLAKQARGNVTGAQQGPDPSDELLDALVSDELRISVAQLTARGLGRLDSCGAGGGPEHLSNQALASGRFDLFDAWIGLNPGSCTSRRADQKRAQIARGQELFNEKQSASGGRCVGCHNVVNNGTNFQGILFDVGVSDPSRAPADMPVYTLRNLATGEVRSTTDGGKAFRSGAWSDVDRFKVPTLRGLSARPPYFHDGSARTLRHVVRHYEDALGFDFTRAEEKDLVAFLEAL